MSDFYAIEHDLALMMTSPEFMEDLIEKYKGILKAAGRPLPVNARFEYNLFSRNKQELKYELE